MRANNKTLSVTSRHVTVVMFVHITFDVTCIVENEKKVVHGELENATKIWNTCDVSNPIGVLRGGAKGALAPPLKLVKV